MKQIPNILSAFRICLVPVFVLVYFLSPTESHWPAAVVYITASLTDMLDGYLARRLNAISDLGRILDPAGDKLMQFAGMVCITVDRIIPLWVVIVFFIKESAMLAGGLVIHNKLKVEMPPSNYIGKTSTVLFFVTCAALMVFPGIPKTTAAWMIGVAMAVTIVAFCSYIFTFIRVVKETKQQRIEN